MAKKKKKTVKKWVDLVGIVVGIIAVAMIALPTIGITVGDEVSEYTGLQVALGYTQINEIGFGISSSVEIFKFSFMALLPYVAILGAVVVLLINVFGKGGKLASIIALALFVVGAVLAFELVNFAIAGETIVGSLIIQNWEIEQLSLLVGAYLTAGFAIFGALTSVYKLIVK